MNIAFFPFDSDEAISIWEDVTGAIPQPCDTVLLNETSYRIDHLH